MNSSIKILAIIFAYFSASFHPLRAADIKGAQGAYEKNGRELLASINSGKVDPAAAKKNVDQMVSSAQVLFSAFSEKYPESKKLETYMKSNLTKIQDLSFEEIERDYHDAGILTKALIGVDIKSEDGEKYTDPLHTLLHPLMTLKAIQKNDLKSAKEELNEGLEQVKNTAKHILK